MSSLYCAYRFLSHSRDYGKIGHGVGGAASINTLCDYVAGMLNASLTGPHIKIDRAKKHVADLRADIEAFHRRQPYQIVMADEPESGDQVYRVKIREPIPPKWSGILGDIFHNLRSALDQVACQLVIANNSEIERSTEFPIIGTPGNFEIVLGRKLNGASAKAKSLVRRLKPYKGGREPFWVIHAMDVLDKHRGIIPAGAAHRNIIITMRMPIPNSNNVIRSSFGLTPADRAYPLKDGTEVFRVKAGGRVSFGEFHDAPQFTFEAAFGEGQVVEGQPIFPTVEQLVQFTERVIEIFERWIIR